MNLVFLAHMSHVIMLISVKPSYINKIAPSACNEIIYCMSLKYFVKNVSACNQSYTYLPMCSFGSSFENSLVFVIVDLLNFLILSNSVVNSPTTQQFHLTISFGLMSVDST